jgi:hypothetical protein
MLAAAVLALGCADRRAPTMPPSYLIQDAVHGGGNPHFYWLPPMVPSPTFSGTFNPTLSPILQIDEVANPALLCGREVATFTMTSGPGSETIRVDLIAQHYIVNWHAGDPAFGLRTECTYRIRALLKVGAQMLELGIADVDVVSNGSGLKNVQTGEFIGLVDNRTLVVKARIEHGAAAVASGGQGCRPGRACVEVVVGAGGGTVIAPGQRAGLQIPDAATDIERIILIEERTERPCFPLTAMALPQFNECYLIQSFPDVPFGDGDPTTLADNYTAGLCVELPPGMTIEQAQRLQVFRFDAEAEAQVLQALQNVPAPFLPCNEQVPSNGGIGLWRFLRDHLATLLLPRRLYAAVAMVDFGVGGSGTETSLFTWSLPSQMTANSPQNQSATSGAPVATPPSVIVRDFGGNPVEGVTVTFSAAAGNGTINGASLPVIVVTGPAGIASLGSWTLPSAAGTFTLTASAPGVSGSPLNFTATAGMEQLTIGTGNPLAIGSANSEQKLAQTVTATSSGMITRVRFPLACQATATLIVEIQGVTADQPNGSVLASQSFAGSTLPGPLTATFRDLAFSSPASVTTGSQFAIVLSEPSNNDQNTCVVLPGPAGDPYLPGHAFFDARPNAPGWVRVSLGSATAPDDLPFQVIVEPVVPGAQLAFHSTRDGNFEIYTMNLAGSGQTRLTNDPLTDFGPDVSTNGTKIAFQKDVGSASEIYMMNADGTALTRLTNNAFHDAGPSWSPDGTKLVFRSLRDGNFEIYVMNADGTGQTRLTVNPARDFDTDWSPDGTQIAFSSDRDDPQFDIYVMNAADGSGVTRLTTSTGNDVTPAWSPDGTKIAFTRDADVWVMNADGSGATQLTVNTAFDGEPAWCPNGRIVFTSTRDGNFEIYIMNADGTGQTRLTAIAALDREASCSSSIPIP